MFSAYTQALRDRNLPEEDIRVLNKIIPDLLFDLRSAGEAFEDMKQMGLSGASPLGEVKTKAPNSDYHTTGTCHRSQHGRRRSRGTTSSARRGSTSSAATRGAPTGLWPPRSRGTTGPDAGLRDGRVREDFRGREPHLWHHRT